MVVETLTVLWCGLTLSLRFVRAIKAVFLRKPLFGSIKFWPLRLIMEKAKLLC